MATQLTEKEWSLVQSALPKAKAQRTAAEINAMGKYRAAGRPSGPGVKAGGSLIRGSVNAGRYARGRNLDPRTGLPRGMDPNRALTGTFAGQRLPRGGRALNPAEHRALRGQRKLEQLTQMLLEDPTALTAYGAEEGIYGPGGYKQWVKDWNKAFRQMGLAPVRPEDWLAQMGHGDPMAPPGWVKTDKQRVQWEREQRESLKALRKRGLGNVSRAAGSNPFDYAPRNEAGQLLLLNQALGRNYGSFDEAMRDLAPITGWAGAQYRSLDFAERKNPNKLQEAYRAIMQLGPGYGKENQLHIDPSGAHPGTNWLAEMFSSGDRGQRNLLLNQLAMVTKDMPAYMKDAYAKVAASDAGKRFGADLIFATALEQLANPLQNVNWRDPSRPLFGPGGATGQLGGGSDSGQRYMASLTPEEFISEFFPRKYMLQNDPASQQAQAALQNRASLGEIGAWQAEPYKGLNSWERFQRLNGMFGGSLRPDGMFQSGTGGQIFLGRRGYGLNQTRYPYPMTRPGGLPTVKQTAWPTIDLTKVTTPEQWASYFSGLPTAFNVEAWSGANNGAIPDYTYEGVPSWMNYWSRPGWEQAAPWNVGAEGMKRMLAALGMQFPEITPM